MRNQSSYSLEESELLGLPELAVAHSTQSYVLVMVIGICRSFGEDHFRVVN